MILFISLLSCNKESVIIPEAQQTINGKVHNQLHESIPNLIVKIDEQSTVTSSDGNFILNNVNTPYDLILFDSLKNSGYFFKGLTLANPEINVISTSFYPRKCKLNVSIPSIIKVSSGKLIFTDTNMINEYMEITGNNNIFNLNLPDGKPIRGKLIALLYTRDASKHIVSYDRFGLKDNITISEGISLNINFLASDLTLNPGQIYVDGTTSYLSMPTNRYFYIIFGKKSYQNFSGDMIFDTFNDPYYCFYIPKNVPLKYSTLFYVSGTDIVSTQVGTVSRQFIVPEGASRYYLQVESPPLLSNPNDHAAGVDENTIFNINSTQYVGAYNVMLCDSIDRFVYYYFTSQKSFDLKWLKKIHNIDLSNRNFLWQAECLTLPNYNLDDYLNPDFNNLNNCDNYSMVSYFSTKH
jgi:hypothetical protein